MNWEKYQAHYHLITSVLEKIKWTVNEKKRNDHNERTLPREWSPGGWAQTQNSKPQTLFVFCHLMMAWKWYVGNKNPTLNFEFLSLQSMEALLQSGETTKSHAVLNQSRIHKCTLNHVVRSSVLVMSRYPISLGYQIHVQFKKFSIYDKFIGLEPQCKSGNIN